MLAGGIVGLTMRYASRHQTTRVYHVPAPMPATASTTTAWRTSAVVAPPASVPRRRSHDERSTTTPSVETPMCV